MDDDRRMILSSASSSIDVVNRNDRIARKARPCSFAVYLIHVDTMANEKVSASSPLRDDREKVAEPIAPEVQATPVPVTNPPPPPEDPSAKCSSTDSKLEIQDELGHLPEDERKAILDQVPIGKPRKVSFKEMFRYHTRSELLLCGACFLR